MENFVHPLNQNPLLCIEIFATNAKSGLDKNHRNTNNNIEEGLRAGAP